MAKEKIRADEIKYALSKRHGEDFFLTEVKTGPSTMQKTLRIDALAIKKSWTQPCFTGYEVKVDRQDFLRDLKYLGYREYCHRLFLACPTGLIMPDEIPDDVGLVYYNPEKRCLFTKKTAKLRDIEINWQMLYYIILSRLSDDRHPFFSSHRDYIESYIQDRADRRDLSILFSTKLTEQVKEANGKATKAEKEIEKYREKAEERDRIVKLLMKKGIVKGEWEVQWHLEKALERQYPNDLYDAASEIDRASRRIQNILLPKDKGELDGLLE